MATQTPNTPKWRNCANTKLNAILHTHMETIEVTIQKRTSLEARSVFGRVNENGQIVTQQMEWYRINCFVIIPVSGVRL